VNQGPLIRVAMVKETINEGKRFDQISDDSES
jgi:hypothetical protein